MMNLNTGVSHLIVLGVGNMIFFQEYELVTFARKKGSKDKRPRKRKASAANEVKPFARRTPGQRKLQDTLRPFRQKTRVLVDLLIKLTLWMLQIKESVKLV